MDKFLDEVIPVFGSMALAYAVATLRDEIPPELLAKLEDKASEFINTVAKSFNAELSEET